MATDTDAGQSEYWNESYSVWCHDGVKPGNRTLYASGGRGAVRGLYHRQNIHGKVNKITVSVLCSDAGSADAGNFCTRGGFVYTEFAFKIRRRWNYDR